MLKRLISSFNSPGMVFGRVGRTGLVSSMAFRGGLGTNRYVITNKDSLSLISIIFTFIFLSAFSSSHGTQTRDRLFSHELSESGLNFESSFYSLVSSFSLISFFHGPRLYSGSRMSGVVVACSAWN